MTVGSGEVFEDVVDEILTALANPTRRAVVRALAEGSTMTFAELMKVCSVRDSSTMKHHLTKLGRLIRKCEDGSYALTPVGYEALRLLEQLEDSLSRLLPLSSSPRPLIVIKPSKRHLTLTAAASAVAALVTGTLLNPYLALIPALVLGAITIYSLLSGSRTVLVGRNSIIEVRSTILGRSERRVIGRVVGVEVNHGSVLEALGLTKLTIILSAAGGMRTYVVGYVEKDVVERRVSDIEDLARTSSQHDRYVSIP